MHQDTINHLAQRQGTIAHWLVWLVARNRATGASQAGGFWSGDDNQIFTINGEARTYFGAGAGLQVDPIRESVGLGVRVQRATLTMTPEGEQWVRGYDLSLAPVEIHRAVFDPITMTLIAAPDEAFAGVVDAAPIEEGPIGGTSTIALEIAGKERSLTRTLPLFKSDSDMRARSETDTFRQYAAEVRRWIVAWGEHAVQEDDAAQPRHPPAPGTPNPWGGS